MGTGSSAGANELRLTRVFDAPVQAVWAAWTEADQVARWWGPRGFSITTHSRDLRPGGTWDYTMHGPDGKDYPNFTRYIEVRECSALVYDHGATNDKTPPMFRVSVTFAESHGKTVMEMTMTLATPEAAEQTRQFIRKAGGDATWDRLAEYLVKEKTGKEKFVINRRFDAPVERVFEAWTDLEQLARWSGPAGTRMELRGEIRPGGVVYSTSAGGDVTMHGRAEYLEVDRPRRIVYTQQFCDANGAVVRHPMAANWPETMLTTVEFAAEGAERTRVALTWEPFGTEKAEEIAAFAKARSGMTMGWTGSFDNLEVMLATVE